MEPKDQYYRRNLPHFHPEGYPLFITFRLANSLPEEVLSRLKQEREQAQSEDSYRIESEECTNMDYEDLLRLAIEKEDISIVSVHWIVPGGGIGKWLKKIKGPLTNTNAYSSTRSSSRTFPGHSSV